MLPGRPPQDVVWAGPTPCPGDRKKALRPTRAICCSGGGIRAAAFALGGLQHLNARTDGDGTVYSKTDFVASVSGGGYTAGSYALVQHNLDSTAPLVYAPGSPEDNRLRAHTRYLIDSKTQLTISLMGIIYGLLMNLAAILAVVFILATLDAVVLGTGVLNALRLDPNGLTFTAHISPWVMGTMLAVIGLGCVVYVLYRIVDMYRERPYGELGTTRWCFVSIVLIGVGLAGLVLFAGVPALLGVLNHAPSKVSRAGAPVKTGTIFGTIVALVGIIQQLIRTYVPTTTAESSDPVVAAAAKHARSFAARFGSRVLPWLGSVLITVLLGVAFLTWVSDFVKAGYDMTYWMCAAGVLLFLIFWRLFTDGNRTSLHRPYTQRLASAFGVTREGHDANDELSTYSHRRNTPDLVICAAVNTDQPGSTPSGRHCAPFTFSAYTAGISSGTMFNDAGAEFDLRARETGGPDRVRWNREIAAPTATARAISHEPSLWMPTDLLENHAKRLSVMDLVAVSGAAVSPAMGRMSRPSLRLLLGVANVRLGMWLPNPLHRRRINPPNIGLAQRIWWQLRQPGLGSLIKEIVGGLSLKGRSVYVTDGGHYENLGLVEALRRGATDIIVFDACGDAPFTLATFGQAVETARADLGVEISLKPGALARTDKGVAAGLAARATATYANGVQATIYLCKAAMTAKLPQDLVAWQDSHKTFPNTTTADQFFGDREFEAYRKLGSIAAEQACALRDADSMRPQRSARRATRSTTAARNSHVRATNHV